MKAVMIILMLLFSCLSWAGAINDIPYPFYAVNNRSENELMPIDSGAAALELRLQMIRRANKSIEVEYFCYNTDLASKIFTHELIMARERGVKVRILIDKASTVFMFNEYYARPLLEKGIEVRYFNNASILNFTKSIYRNHRKLLLVDGKEAITGGRNMGDEYFDMSHVFNYSDRDIYVKGPIVRAMLDSFNIYFESKMTQKKIKLPKSTTNKKARAARAFYQFTEKELETKKGMEILGQKALDDLKTFTCPETTFATDAPGGGIKGFFSESYVDKYRFLRKVLLSKISDIDKSLLVSTPYFLTNDDSRTLIKGLLEKKAAVNIYTNSLAASDATYMSTRMYATLKSWNRKGVDFFFHTGEFPGDHELLNDRVLNAHWSDHSKTHIYESESFSEIMIGTFNLHNRSTYYDSEMAIFCKGSDDLTSEVKGSVLSRMEKGLRINDQNEAIDSKGNKVNKFGTSTGKIIKMKLLGIPVWLMKFIL